MSFHCMWLKLSPSTVHILEVSGQSFALAYFVDTSGPVLVHCSERKIVANAKVKIA